MYYIFYDIFTKNISDVICSFLLQFCELGLKYQLSEPQIRVLTLSVFFFLFVHTLYSKTSYSWLNKQRESREQDRAWQ